MAAKRALITGITGQDGSYLAELLLDQKYEVWGVLRRSSSFNTGRIEHLYQDPHEPDARLRLVHGDLGDTCSLRAALEQSRPDEVYNLGAQSHVRVSFDVPEFTADSVAMGTVRLLEAVRQVCPEARFYQASSSEMFGDAPPPQSESTTFRPCSPYAAAKCHAFYAAQMYRKAYGMFVSNGILFNHGGPRRLETFVTRKITRAAARIKLGLQHKLYLGNLRAKRDWGYAEDFVRAMWLMLQADEPDDFVIATGESHSVQELVELAFGLCGLDWKTHVEYDPRYERPAEVPVLLGNAAKAQERLGWAPTVGFRELVERMVEHDLRLAKEEQLLQACGG